VNSSGTVLDRILSETREEVARRRRAVTEDQLRDRVRPPRGGADTLRRALAAPGVGVIAEFKRRSPSAGSLAESPDLHSVLGAYERGGAVAVSVLTEGPNFGGSLEDLLAAREACALPILRKDFVVDPYQLLEASAAGADAVLLIVAALDPAELASLRRQARELGLDVLVEVHDGAELEVALAAGAELIGINNRDLRDFTVDIDRTERLMGEVPAGVSVVSESGISRPEQIARLRERGVAGVLVGETLMRAGDPAAALRSLIEPPSQTRSL
jgi:indole-3-glycerol phosphate synthase